MEGVYTFAVATAISVVIVNLVGFRPNKLTVLLITLLYVTAIAVWFIPIFPSYQSHRWGCNEQPGGDYPWWISGGEYLIAVVRTVV